MADFSAQLDDQLLSVSVGVPVFDARRVPAFKQALCGYEAGNPARVEVDLGRVEAIDSSALSALLWLCQRTRRQQIRLHGASARVRAAIATARLQRVLFVVPPAASQ
ncbi:MAG: hypothetical protein RLZZ598_947 [Pseudomonadota bacterium]|jgi:anti-anti-sigma factor